MGGRSLESALLETGLGATMQHCQQENQVGEGFGGPDLNTSCELSVGPPLSFRHNKIHPKYSSGDQSVSRCGK